MVGEKTRRAIAKEQTALGRKADGRASQGLLEILRAAGGASGEGVSHD
jgi:hypothetical protein